MITDPRRLVALAFAALVLSGCVESQRPEASGKGTISAIHAAPTAAELAFLIEERSLGNLTYKGAIGAQPFDDLTYDFNFDARVPGSASLQRIATETVSIVAGMDYVFALTGTVSAPSVVVWESEDRQWEGSETVLEVSAGHLAAGTGAVDLYFEAPGTAPIGGNARGSLSFGERLPAFDVEDGRYVLIVTEQGDPATILFTSASRDYNQQTTVLFTLHDADPSITSALSVRRIEEGGSSVELGDTGSPPTRRYFNAAFSSGNVDVWLDDDFATPIVADLGYGGVSADVPVPSGASTYTYTTAGNPGAVLLEDEETVAVNTRGTNFLMGASGDLETVSVIDNRRAISGFAKVRVTQLSANLDLVDAYLLNAGTDINDVGPNIPRINTADSSDYLHLQPGNYELTVTQAGGKTVVAGPLALDLTSGDIAEVALIDTADPNLLNIVAY